ncbi:saccharopine dehydrogenase NADP-binding domain-containing protein [Mycobacterium sp.]|uniref:saccharopine dehydrogenase NADP-binding domain-containing protein n=1 Tax=Mycobacterium sp. TaxID=1785 RepID=UPI0012847DB9|nr:saccharopine dehydrogenase NADP-binding domain-containing protein [Mycobacterium sp.]KAA8965442.1 MAG: NAD(P)H-binding protein [Mycobacterium sp.]
MTRVLLLGSSGAVGQCCLQTLTRSGEVSVLIAGRDETRLRAVASATRADVEIARVDVTDKAAVTALAARSDVVINCAGPAHRLSAPVVDVAAAAGVPYVDPGGDDGLLDRLGAAGVDVPVVLQAGVQPGLSGLLLRVLASHRPDKIDGITVWCGGLQRLTPASVLEYLASVQDTHGHPGAALRAGVIRRVGHDECKPAPGQYFPESVTVRPYLDAETIAVAAHLGVDNVWWMNVFDGARTTRAMQLLAGGQADVGDVQAAVKLDLFGRQPYFTIVGNAHGNGGTTTIVFSCQDSYRVTGALVAYVAYQVVDLPAGVRAFWTLDEPQRALQFLDRVVPEAAVSVVDEPTTGIAGGYAPLVEEGSL